MATGSSRYSHNYIVVVRCIRSDVNKGPQRTRVRVRSVRLFVHCFPPLNMSRPRYP